MIHHIELTETVASGFHTIDFIESLQCKYCRMNMKDIESVGHEWRWVRLSPATVECDRDMVPLYVVHGS